MQYRLSHNQKRFIKRSASPINLLSFYHVVKQIINNYRKIKNEVN